MGAITDFVQGLLASVDAFPLWQLHLVVGALLVAETTVGVGWVTPGEVVLLAAATTVSTPAEFAGLAAVAAGASLVGQTGGYLWGLRFGGRIRASWVGRRIGADDWARAEDLLRGGSGRALIGSRFLAVAHSLVPVVAGTLRMPPHRFGRYTAIGVVAWAIVYVALGSVGSAAIRGSGHPVGPVFTGAAVVAVGVAVGVVHLRRRRSVLR